MKRVSSILVILCVTLTASYGQINTARWKFSVVNKPGNIAEIHAVASIDEGWHIYSQTTPPGGPNPTIFHFSANPLVQLEGKTKESGKLKQRFEKVFKVEVKYYEGKVEFIQRFKLKTSVKTNLNGTVSYMICSDEMCLPPQTEKFDLKLG